MKGNQAWLYQDEPKASLILRYLLAMQRLSMWPSLLHRLSAHKLTVTEQDPGLRSLPCLYTNSLL